MSKKIVESWCLVKWNEFPPKWDIFATKLVLGEVAVNSRIKAPWGKGWAEADIVSIG
jgi:hypothetical protein